MPSSRTAINDHNSHEDDDGVLSLHLPFPLPFPRGFSETYLPFIPQAHRNPQPTTVIRATNQKIKHSLYCDSLTDLHFINYFFPILPNNLRVVYLGALPGED